MYAIVEIAGKQFRVEKEQKIKVPLLSVESGKKVSFDRVLFYADDAGKTEVGSPVISGLQVQATVLEHGRDKKIIVFKKKRRKGYQKKNGHRQHFSLIQIEGIGKAKPAKKETAAKSEDKPKTAAKEAKPKTKEAPKTAKKAAPAKAKAAAKPKKEAAPKVPKAGKTTSKAKTAAKPKADKKDSAGEKEA